MIKNFKASKNLSQSQIKQLYNLRYKIKQLDNKHPITQGTINSIVKSSNDFKTYRSDLENTLFNLRQKRDKKQNKKLYLQREMKANKYVNPEKYAKAKLQYLKKYKKEEYNKQKNSLEKKIKSKKPKNRTNSNIDYRVNKYGLKMKKSDIDLFYKKRNKFNKKVSSEMKRLEKDNPSLYDFIFGKVPSGAKVGDYLPAQEGMFTFKDKTQFNQIFDKKSFDIMIKKYDTFEKVGSIEQFYENQKKNNLLQIFEQGRYSDLDKTKMQEFFNKAKGMDYPSFYAWYSNNRDKISHFYDIGRVDIVGWSDEDILEEVDNIINSMDYYKKEFKKFYK